MKKRRASVLCRWTRYMRQPASCRDAVVSLRKISATSSSCPGFAIQMTANTTMRTSKLQRSAVRKLLKQIPRGLKPARDDKKRTIDADLKVRSTREPFIEQLTAAVQRVVPLTASSVLANSGTKIVCSRSGPVE